MYTYMVKKKVQVLYRDAKHKDENGTGIKPQIYTYPLFERRLRAGISCGCHQGFTDGHRWGFERVGSRLQGRERGDIDARRRRRRFESTRTTNYVPSWMSINPRRALHRCFIRLRLPLIFFTYIK